MAMKRLWLPLAAVAAVSLFSSFTARADLAVQFLRDLVLAFHQRGRVWNREPERGEDLRANIRMGGGRIFQLRSVA